MNKVYLRIQGKKRTHYKSPNLAAREFTLCGAQWIEDDELCEMEALGDAPQKAKVTCSSCNEIVRACKRINSQ